MTERYEQLRAGALELVRMKERLEAYSSTRTTWTYFDAKSVPGFLPEIEKAIAGISAAHELLRIESKKER